MIAAGELPYVRSGESGLISIDIRDCDAWIDRNKQIAC
jgi:hypothetical protein